MGFHNEKFRQAVWLMLIGAALVSTIYMLFREEVNRRNAAVVRTENKL